MTDTIVRPSVEERPTQIPLLPTEPKRMGPTTRFLVLRTVACIALVEVIGTLLVAFGGISARAAGLSLVFPGAGFLYTAHPLLFVVTWVVMSLAIVLWWGMSMHLGIPGVWLLSAAVSGLLATGPRLFVDRGTTWGWAVPLAYVLAVACIGTLVWTFESRFRRKRALVPELNEYLRTAEVPAPSTALREGDDMDAELLRWVYELSLQPVDRFDGFEWGDQLHGGTVVRYQLNYLGWALAPFAVNYVPNALGTVELAMRNLVLKQLDLRVWRYWQLLNRVGNLDSNPDPLVRDNIMFSGFTGDQINLYEAATGSTRFDEPGSLTFVWEDGRTFAYDHHSWMEAVKKNFDRSRLGFFPCEPGWAFAACNTIGAQALFGHDRIHGTTMWSDIEPRWRETLEREYLLPDGNYANIRSTHTGLSWDTGETPGRRVLHHRLAQLQGRRPRPAQPGPGAVAARSATEDGRTARADQGRGVAAATARGVGAQPLAQVGDAGLDEADRRRPSGRRRRIGRGGDPCARPAVRDGGALAGAAARHRRRQPRAADARALVDADGQRVDQRPRLRGALGPDRRVGPVAAGDDHPGPLARWLVARPRRPPRPGAGRGADRSSRSARSRPAPSTG